MVWIGRLSRQAKIWQPRPTFALWWCACRDWCLSCFFWRWNMQPRPTFTLWWWARQLSQDWYSCFFWWWNMQPRPTFTLWWWGQQLSRDWYSCFFWRWNVVGFSSHSGWPSVARRLFLWFSVSRHPSLDNYCQHSVKDFSTAWCMAQQWFFRRGTKRASHCCPYGRHCHFCQSPFPACCNIGLMHCVVGGIYQVFYSLLQSYGRKERFFRTPAAFSIHPNIQICGAHEI